MITWVKEEKIKGLFECCVVNYSEIIILELDRKPRIDNLNISKGTNCNALKQAKYV